LKKLKHIWIFSDSIKGHEIQSQALAHALSSHVTLYYCSIRQPWLSFAPRILPRFGKNIVWKNSQPDKQSTPNLIITCGRRMAAIGKFYKRKTGSQHLQILNPGDGAGKYDILVCPEHDNITGDNVITTRGSLHGITDEILTKYKDNHDFANSLVLLLGNPEKKFFTQLDDLKKQIEKNFSKHSVIVCGSRRTPKKYFKVIRQAINDAKIVWLSKEDGENPYLSLLAQGSVFVVTADSINMVSEVCATDKPVIAIAQNAISPKHKRFIQSINERLSQFGNVKEKNVPLNELNRLYEEVAKRLN
jgi:mitochondrial fission protein ELM1